ncbi:hypothetical protein BRADI_4g14560v3 [Brachypodium distachyon]|uniref:DUF629 domain-containing protein n=1 Tax=Brachypodium distachyon TaxID=15368 RepID=A0A0Q3EJU3_BRADI|nr:hypothetical protein BRADI_4g14560v3 [Brachypodium distachyon]
MVEPAASAGVAALRKEAEAVRALDRDGHHDEAHARLDELVDRHAGSPLVLHLAGLFHHAAARRAKDEKDLAAQHLVSAELYVTLAKRFAPNCIEISALLARVLFEASKHEEAEAEIRRAIEIPWPVDPAENNVVYDEERCANTTRDQRVENSREMATLFFKVIGDWVCNNYVPAVVGKVLEVELDADDREGAAQALKSANDLAKRYPYSSRAQLFRAYMKLNFARGLDATMDRRPFLDRIRRNMNEAANLFESSLVLAIFRAKLCFVLGLYGAAYLECVRGFNTGDPVDPKLEDVPPGSVDGEECADRLSSIYTEFARLIRRVVWVVKGSWDSMTSAQQDSFLSVRLFELRKYYDDVYEDDHWAARTISDAMTFVKKTRSWRFWICPYCVGKKLPDTDSLLRHMCSKHPAEKDLPKLRTVLEPKGTSVDDNSLDEITVGQDSEDHYFFHFKKKDYIFEHLFLKPSTVSDEESFAKIREEKIKEGTEILEKIKQRLRNLPTDNLSAEFYKARTEIQDLWHDFLAISLLDYRVVILPLVKSFLWEELIKFTSDDKTASKSISNADIDTVFPSVLYTPNMDAMLELTYKLSDGNKDHESGEDQETVNIKDEFIKSTSEDNAASKSIDNADIDTVFPNVVYASGSNAILEHTYKLSNGNKDHESGEDQETENMKPSGLDKTLVDDEKGEERCSEDLLEDRNSETLIDKKLSDPTIYMDGSGKSAARIATLERNKKGTSGQSVGKMASNFLYQPSVNIFNHKNAEKVLSSLRVIIQSLCNLKHLRDKFLMGELKWDPSSNNPCIADLLYEIFFAWERYEPYPTVDVLTSVKTILLRLADDSSIYEKVGEIFASETVVTILIGLHMSDTCSSFSFNTEIGGNVVNPITCGACICPTHNLFGINFNVQMSCRCGKCSDKYLYTTLFHILDAGSAQTTKIKSFSELQFLLDEQFCEDHSCKNCGIIENVDLFLSNMPQFFTIVLNWASGSRSQDTFSEVLAGITSPLDADFFCRSAHSATKYVVTSMICYADERYLCFARDEDSWLIFDSDKITYLLGIIC